MTEELRLGFAFAAGVATFFSPCAYPLLPGYLAFYIGDADERGTWQRRLARAVAVGALASLGFFLVYTAIAVVVIVVGTRILSNIALLELFVGSFLVVLGLGMSFGKLRPDSLHVRLPERRRSPSGYLLFGIIYAIAAAGCTAPVFAAIATVGIASGSTGAILTFGAYAAGMAVLMIVVTILAAAGRDGLIRLVSGRTGRVAQVTGVLIFAAGVIQLYLFLFRFGGIKLLSEHVDLVVFWDNRSTAAETLQI